MTKKILFWVKILQFLHIIVNKTKFLNVIAKNYGIINLVKIQYTFLKGALYVNAKQAEETFQNEIN